jgi:hypothetical protein
MELDGAVVHKSESVTYRELQGEGVLYNTSSKSMHILNKTALAVWNLCDIAESPVQIANTIAQQYNVTNDVVFPDVLECLNRFEELGLIRRSSL